MNAAFYDAVRVKLFGGALTQKAVDGINAIEKAWTTYGDGDQRKLAYILATAYHESDRFKTMQEYASGKAYEGRADLGNTVPGDGVRFKGRGFVQLTGRRNYNDWSKRLGIDVVANPERVCEPATAARILVQGMMLGTFTGRKLSDYIHGPKCEMLNARPIVNGMDKASMIAGYAETFQKALSLDAGAIPPPPDIEPTVHPPLTPQPPVGDQTRKPGTYVAVGAGVGALVLALINFLLERLF